MPTNREAVVNRALSGSELRTIIERRFFDLLDAEGLLSPHMAYAPVAFDIELRLHLANPFNPESVSRTVSQRTSETPAIQGAPPLLLGPDDSSVVSATMVTQRITSPNRERLREGMPVDHVATNLDGTKVTEKISYPRQSGLGDSDVVVTDTTDAVRAAWGIPDEPEPVV